MIKRDKRHKANIFDRDGTLVAKTKVGVSYQEGRIYQQRDTSPGTSWSIDVESLPEDHQIDFGKPIFLIVLEDGRSGPMTIRSILRYNFGAEGESRGGEMIIFKGLCSIMRFEEGSDFEYDFEKRYDRPKTTPRKRTPNH